MHCGGHKKIEQRELDSKRGEGGEFLQPPLFGKRSGAISLFRSRPMNEGEDRQ